MSCAAVALCTPARGNVLLVLSGAGECDRSHSFPFDHESDGTPFGSSAKGKLSIQSYFFQIQKNMIVVIVFLLIMNQTEVRLVHMLEGNCHCNHIPWNLKAMRSIFL